MVRCVDHLEPGAVNSDIDSQEWKALNHAVTTVCEQFVKKLPSSNSADYVISNDNWGGVSQRIFVFNPRLLCKAFALELAATIKQLNLLGAHIELLFDFTKHSQQQHSYLSGMLIVHSSGVDEVMMDVKALKQQFGSWFYDSSD
jgi:hypothetical protein